MSATEENNESITQSNGGLKITLGSTPKRIYKHKEGCDCPIVNPVTEWVGGRYMTITKWKCPKCGEETPVQNPKWYARSSIYWDY